MKKVAIGVFVVGALAALYVWFFVYNKKHVDVASADAKYELTVQELAKEFETNKDSATKKFNNAIINISGTLAQVAKDDSVSSLVFKVNENLSIACEVLSTENSKALTLKENQTVTTKGLFVGYIEGDVDFEIPNEVKLKKCIIK